MGPQLPLSVQLADSASFDNFYPGPNATASAAVQALAEGRIAGAGATPLLLHGPVGSGKTHLLQAAVRTASKRGVAAYLPLGDLPELSPALLDGLDDTALIAIDDVDRLGSAPEFALALLRLLDVLRMRGAAYLLAAARAIDRETSRLPPDLRTRLAACAQFPLKPLDDHELANLLQARAQRRGLELPIEVAEFMLRRLPRRIPTLLDALETLDGAALSAQRRLTIPFVVLALPALAPSTVRTEPG